MKDSRHSHSKTKQKPTKMECEDVMMVAREEANSAQCHTNPEGERRHSQAEPGGSLPEHLRSQSPPGDVHLVLTTQSANKERATLTTCTSHRSHQRLLLGLNDKRTGNRPDLQTQLRRSCLSCLTVLHSGFRKEALQASPFLFHRQCS